MTHWPRGRDPHGEITDPPEPSYPHREPHPVGQYPKSGGRGGSDRLLAMTQQLHEELNGARAAMEAALEAAALQDEEAQRAIIHRIDDCLQAIAHQLRPRNWSENTLAGARPVYVTIITDDTPQRRAVHVDAGEYGDRVLEPLRDHYAGPYNVTLETRPVDPRRLQCRPGEAGQQHPTLSIDFPIPRVTQN